MKELDIRILGHLRATIPLCQRVPSNVTQGDQTNICNRDDISLSGEWNEHDSVQTEEHSQPSFGAIGIRQDTADSIRQGNTIPIYHLDTYIGQIQLDTLADKHYFSKVPSQAIELDFYIVRYFKVADYYVSMDKYRVKTSSGRGKKSTWRKCHHSSKVSLQEKFDYEMVWLQNAILTYLPNLRKLYKYYARLMNDGDDDDECIFEATLIRLAWWQMLRDYKLQKQFDSLVSLEMIFQRNPYIGLKNEDFGDKKETCHVRRHKNRQFESNPKNLKTSKTEKLDIESSLIRKVWEKIENSDIPKLNSIEDDRDIFDPFGRISFCEFVHYMLELAWCLFSGQRASHSTPWPTHLSGCLFRLIGETFKRQGEEGEVLRSERYRRMMPGVYDHFTSVGNPLSVRQLLRLLKTNKLHGNKDQVTSYEGFVLIDQPDETRFGFADKSDLCVEYENTKKDDKCGVNESEPTETDDVAQTPDFHGENLQSLDIYNNFFKLEIHEILNAVAHICPRLMSGSTVLNIEMSLNFLEYFELLVLLCKFNAEKTRRLLKAEVVDAFYNERIAPLVERELAARLARKRRQAAAMGRQSRPGTRRTARRK